MPHLEFDAISASFSRFINHLDGTLKTTVMVIADFGDNEGAPSPYFEVMYLDGHAFSFLYDFWIHVLSMPAVHLTQSERDEH